MTRLDPYFDPADFWRNLHSNPPCTATRNATATGTPARNADESSSVYRSVGDSTNVPDIPMSAGQANSFKVVHGGLNDLANGAKAIDAHPVNPFLGKRHMLFTFDSDHNIDARINRLFGLNIEVCAPDKVKVY